MCLPYSEEQCVKGTLLEPQHPRMSFRKLCETYGIKKRYLKQKTRNNSGVVIVVLCERWNWPGVRKLPLRTDGTWISLYCYCAQNLTKTDRRDARASCLAYGGWLGADVLSHRPLHGSERGVGAACSAPLDNTVVLHAGWRSRHPTSECKPLVFTFAFIPSSVNALECFKQVSTCSNSNAVSVYNLHPERKDQHLFQKYRSRSCDYNFKQLIKTNNFISNN